jgi:hypothetical protein
MVKKAVIIIGLLVLFFFKGSPQIVFGADTPSVPASGCSGANWSGCSSVYSEDGVFASVFVDDIQDDTGVMSFSGINVPSNATITGITVREKGKFSSGVGTCQKSIALSKNGGSSWQTNSPTNDLFKTGCNTSNAFTTWSTSTADNNFNSYGWLASDFGSNFRVLVGYNVSTTNTRSIDYYDVYITYALPSNSIYIASASAEPVAGYASINFYGTTAQNSTSMLCDIALLERCSKSGYAQINSDSAIAHIKLAGDYLGNTTLDLGGGYFQGYGWGSSNNWYADSVRVPYHEGFECDYPISITCQTDRVIDFSENYSQNNTLVATPSASLMSSTLTEPEPTNPLAWVVWKGKQIIIDLFYPHDSITSQMTQYKDELMATKAPIAYAKAVFDIDWSNETQSTASPTLHIALANNANGVIPDINWTAPDFFVTAMNTLRTALNIVLWLSFVLYIVVRARTLFV